MMPRPSDKGPRVPCCHDCQVFVRWLPGPAVYHYGLECSNDRMNGLSEDIKKTHVARRCVYG